MKNSLLRATPACALNDPFELKASDEEIDGLNKSYSHRGDMKPFHDHDMNKSGVISLSETKDNLLMWSHYADEHSGGVIEFTFDVNLETGKQGCKKFLETLADNLYLFNRVKYRPQREPDLDLFENVDEPVTTSLKKYISFTKAEAWSDEKEHRFLCNLDGADFVCISDTEDVKNLLAEQQLTYEDTSMFNNLLHLTNFKSPCSLDQKMFDRVSSISMVSSKCRETSEISLFHFFKIKPASVTGIYLGCKSQLKATSECFEKESLDKFSQLNGNIQKAKLCSSRYELIFESFIK